MAYTSVALVKARIPHDSSSDYGGALTDADITAHIARAGGLVDDASSAKYGVPFNAYDSSKTDGTDTYVCPGLVQEAAELHAVAASLGQLRAQVRNSVIDDEVTRHQQRGDAALLVLRAVDDWLPWHTYRDLSLTFGTSSDESWQLGEYRAFIEPDVLDSGGTPFLHLETMKISSNSDATGTGYTAAQLAEMRIGMEYSIEYSDKWQRWVFTAHNTNLKDATDLKVTFNWSYRKVLNYQNTFSGRFMHG